MPKCGHQLDLIIKSQSSDTLWHGRGKCAGGGGEMVVREGWGEGET